MSKISTANRASTITAKTAPNCAGTAINAVHSRATTKSSSARFYRAAKKTDHRSASSAAIRNRSFSPRSGAVTRLTSAVPTKCTETRTSNPNPRSPKTYFKMAGISSLGSNTASRSRRAGAGIYTSTRSPTGYASALAKDSASIANAASSSNTTSPLRTTRSTAMKRRSAGL